MKNHSRTGMKRGSLGYRTPSQFRFTAHLKNHAQPLPKRNRPPAEKWKP